MHPLGEDRPIKIGKKFYRKGCPGKEVTNEENAFYTLYRLTDGTMTLNESLEAPKIIAQAFMAIDDEVQQTRSEILEIKREDAKRKAKGNR